MHFLFENIAQKSAAPNGFIYAPMILCLFFLFFPLFSGGTWFLLWNWSTELPETRVGTCFAVFSCKRGGRRVWCDTFAPQKGGAEGFSAPCFGGSSGLLFLFCFWRGAPAKKKQQKQEEVQEVEDAGQEDKQEGEKTEEGEPEEEEKQEPAEENQEKCEEEEEEEQKQEPAEEEGQGFPSCFLSLPSSASLLAKEGRERRKAAREMKERRKRKEGRKEQKARKERK